MQETDRESGKHCQESDFSDAGTWGCAQVHLGWEKAVLANYGELTFPLLFQSYFPMM